MTVLVDPRVAIDSITPTGTTQGTAAGFTRSSSTSVVLVDLTADLTGVILPDDAVVGDVVEVLITNTHSYTLRIYPQSGASINNAAVDAPLGVAGISQILRYVGTNDWRTIGFH